MAFSDDLLYHLSRRWPAEGSGRYGDEALDNGDPGSDAYRLAYARFQFERKVRHGLGQRVWDLDALEIGCGHGGIACFMAVAGARSVTGIDLNTTNLRTAAQFAADLSAKLGVGSGLPVVFKEMRAESMSFSNGAFDLVVADNLFEHVDAPLAVLKEVHRVLRPQGTLLVPNVPSILSKFGLHLRYGFKVPWANLAFSDRTIISTLRRIAEDDPRMFVVYPGLAGECVHIRDVRRYRDLNGMTYGLFKDLARQAGFEVLSLTIAPQGYAGKVLSKVPILKDSRLADILSVGASAVLRKPGRAPQSDSP